MRDVKELESIVKGISVKAIDSAYGTLGQLEQGELDLQSAYQEILEMVVYDILKTPKK